MAGRDRPRRSFAGMDQSFAGKAEALLELMLKAAAPMPPNAPRRCRAAGRAPVKLARNFFQTKLVCSAANEALISLYAENQNSFKTQTHSRLLRPVNTTTSSPLSLVQNHCRVPSFRKALGYIKKNGLQDKRREPKNQRRRRDAGRIQRQEPSQHVRDDEARLGHIR